MTTKLQCLLLSAVLIASAQTQSTTPISTPSTPAGTPPAGTTPQTSPETVPSSTSTTAVNGRGLPTNSTWLNGLLTLASRLSSQASTQRNISQSVNGLLGQLPGLLQGLGGVNLQGNDAGQLLAGLFSDPNTAGVPAWIEALMAPGSNTSLSLQDAQTLLQSFSQQDPDGQLQTLLTKVFTDVTQGLQSLNVTANSTSQDVISAILNDTGLMSSLSSDALQLLGVMGGPEVLQQLLQQQFPVDPNSQCGADLSALGTALQQGDIWAFQMLDAMGKLQAGLLTGMTILFGDYDECLDISHVNGSRTIQGQFCSVNLAIPEFLMSLAPGVQAVPNAHIELHLCLPRSCATQEQVKFLLQPTVEALRSKFLSSNFFPEQDPSEDSLFIGTIATLGVLVLLCAAGTAYSVILDWKKEKTQASPVKATANGHTNNGFTKHEDGHMNGGLTNGNVGNKDIESMGMENSKNGGVRSQNGTATVDVKQSPSKESLPSQLLLSFSVLRNGRKVLNCDKNSADISCLHGIRVLSITWVVLGHCFTGNAAIMTNPGGVAKMVSHFTYTAIVSGVLAVDTFFMLSGFLSAFLFLRTTKKTGHLTVSGVILYYVHRIWRLTPFYGLMILVYMGVAPYLMEGPASDAQFSDVPACRDYWYLNILYVNNFFDLRKLCFGWSWYLSNDMQFSFLAPLVIIPWCLGGRVKIIGFLLTAGMILTHCISTGVLMYTRDLTMLGSKQLEYMADVYFKPWCRIGPYAVGLILGYILHVTRGKYTMSKMSAFLGWTMAAVVGLTLVYIPYDNTGKMMTEGLQWSVADNAAYESLFRVLWAVCVSWVVFACTTGYGGFVNTLMSWSAWIPLSRLSYGVYLIHLIIIQVYFGNTKKPFYLDGWIVTEVNLTVTVLSFLLSFLFSMLVEAPTLGLEKAVLGRIFGKRK